MGTVHPPDVESRSGIALRLGDLISALSYALDLTEGQPMGHSVKSCMFGMRLAQEVGLDVDQQADLYYALLLKDAGCSSNSARMHEMLGGDEVAAKREIKAVDWRKNGMDSLRYAMRNMKPGRAPLERLVAMAGMALNRERDGRELVQLRCSRGADIARKLGLSDAAAAGIFSLDEHWDGKGFPEGLAGESIPLISRFLNVCQTFEVFYSLSGPRRARAVLEERAGSWFDPELVRAAVSIDENDPIWDELQGDEIRDRVVEMEPGAKIVADENCIDEVCEAFADVIDVKSPFTNTHSRAVAKYSVAIVEHMGFSNDDVRTVRRASLLHDIGKLGVPNSILDKPERLTEAEFAAVKLHPYYTERILERIAGFEDLAFLAAAHHEKLDGSGYHRGLRGDELPAQARAIAVADIYDALSAERPYREALSRNKVLSIIGEDVPDKLCGDCFDALRAIT